VRWTAQINNLKQFQKPIWDSDIAGDLIWASLKINNPVVAGMNIKIGFFHEKRA